MSCGHETKRGGACEADFGLCEKCGKCFNHCPHRETQRRKAKQKGGKTAGGQNRKRPVLPSESPPLPSSVEEAARGFAWLYKAVLDGDVDPRTARDCGYLLRGFVDAAEVDVEERLKEVEGRLQAVEDEQEPWK